ncbi:hypothetical protein SynNOUM97013_01170 [Synechococcus sp. NOUM97013]|nr:hypothetical protein SynNOUM97013_01170 [Synechococcus sp. NOUM97013]
MPISNGFGKRDKSALLSHVQLPQQQSWTPHLVGKWSAHFGREFFLGGWN